MRRLTLAASALCLVQSGPAHADGPLRRLFRPDPPIVIEVPVYMPPAPSPVVPGPVAPFPIAPVPELIAPPLRPAGPSLPDWITPLDRGPIHTIYVPQGSPAWPVHATKTPEPVLGKLDGLDKRLGELDKRLAAMEKLLIIHDDLLRGVEKK